VRPVHCLRLGGGVPPRVQQEHNSAAVRLSPSPPALRLIRNRRQRGSVWKRWTRALRSRVRPSRYSYTAPPAVQPVAHDRKQTGELREDQGLVSLLSPATSGASPASGGGRSRRR
jgi:hypothetical protein